MVPGQERSSTSLPVSDVLQPLPLSSESLDILPPSPPCHVTIFEPWIIGVGSPNPEPHSAASIALNACKDEYDHATIQWSTRSHEWPTSGMEVAVGDGDVR